MALPIIRLLGKQNINITAVFGSADEKSPYQKIISSSKYINSRVFFDEKNYAINLINVLTEFGETCKNKPVLFIASDQDLNIISTHRDELKKYYNFSLPSDEKIKSILNKEKFISLTEKFHLPVPKSFWIKDINQINEISKTLEFPFIIKPSWRNNEWLKLFKEKKLFLVENKDELQTSISIIKNFKTEYLIQEIIPGPEENIYCSFAILDKNSDPIDIGFCRKLTQYPPQFGNTSIAQTIYNKQLEQLSLDIFKKLNLIGYASIEFKLDPRDNHFKIIEITPNRFNRQFSVTNLIGLNLTLTLYNFEKDINSRVKSKNFSNKLWISEVNEIRRIKNFSKRKVKDTMCLILNIFRAGIFEIFDIKDLKPFVNLLHSGYKTK